MRKFLFPLAALVIALIQHCAHAQTFTDPSFESYAVDSGDFLKPTSGPWTFANDAGVVEPYAPNSSTAALNTWSATFSPVEGQQYASTYAGGDSIRQSVTFATAGLYEISVYAAAPSGTVTIPTNGTLNLATGAFTFTLGFSDFGSSHALDPGTDWTQYSDEFSIATPGTYLLGTRNTVIAPYFINYDSFAIQAVPEPCSSVLFALGIFATGLYSWRRACLAGYGAVAGDLLAAAGCGPPRGANTSTLTAPATTTINPA